MLEFNTEDNIKKVKIDGDVYSVRLPSIVIARDLAKQIEKADDDYANIDIMISFLESSGIPNGVLERCSIEQVESLVQVAMPSKKK
jgi:hypothetical protein